MNVCEDITLLNILRIFKEILGVVTIVIPVILVIFVIIEVIKAITAGDVNTKKLFGSIVKKIVAGVVIFLLMPIINTVMGLVDDDLYFADCWSKAKKDEINIVATTKADEAISQAATCNGNDLEKARVAVRSIPDKKIRKNYEEKYDSVKNSCKQK